MVFLFFFCVFFFFGGGGTTPEVFSMDFRRFSMVFYDLFVVFCGFPWFVCGF